jgi:signal transduction histidine kinase
MTVTALIQLLFAALVLITGLDWLRHRSRARLDIWLVFCCLLIPALLPAAAALLGATMPLFDIVAILAILIQPLLLLRLVGHFQRVPRRVWGLTLAAMLVTLALLVVWGEPSPVLATLTVVVYFLVVEIYPGWAFGRAARAAGGVVRRRLAFATAGTLLLAVTVALSGLPILWPGMAALGRALTELSTLLAAAAYYVSFATPRWLRRTWQLEELYRYLRAPVDVGVAGLSERALTQLCTTATRTAGGVGSAVWLWEAGAEQLAGRAAVGLTLPGPLALAEAGPLGQAWTQRRPVTVRAADLPNGLAPTTQTKAVQFLVAVPIASSKHAWGVLGLFLRHRSLFPDDDVALLSLLADQTAEALELDALFQAERRLLDRLAQTNSELQAEIAERRQVEAEVQRLNETLMERAALLEAANQELEAFSYSVSHDLRSPLRAIDGFSQALLEDYAGQLDATGQDYLQRVRRGAQRMAQIIDDLLRLAWLSRTALQVESVDLSGMARAVLAELQTTEPGRMVEAVVADGLATRGDARLLRAALENLLGNAWKFTGRQPRARIELSAAPLNGQPVFCVRDNGAGFDSTHADRLFGAFQRMHTQDEFPGTGIGLAIVQRVIQRHAGRVWAESQPGQGAAFYFVLGAEGGV